jgi:autotransporter-associated beta strand protein
MYAAVSIAQAQAPKPNIVVIMTDDAGFNEFGFNSALHSQPTQFETPNLDALAQRGVVARQGYAAAPLCSPSRAGLLTGQYQQRFGFDYNTDPNFRLPNEPGLPGDQLIIAEHLKTLGYSTGMVGKWHVGYDAGDDLPTDKGFDEFYGFYGGGRSYFTDGGFARVIRKGTQDYEAQYRTEGDPSTYDPTRGRYLSDAFGDEAASFVKRHANDQQPFFLYMAPFAPHAPHEAKQQDLDRFAHIADPFLRLKVAMNYALDRSVGQVLGALDDPNGDGNTSDSVRDNTIVVFLNDNGGQFGQDNSPLPGNKGRTWEGGIRVPFIVSMPGVVAGVYDAPITAYDVLPTVYAAAGGDVAQLDSDGVDLKPYFTGAATGDPHEAMFWRTNNIWAVRKGKWKYADPLGSAQLRLFDLEADPHETTDVAAQHPEVVADMLRELTLWEATLEKPTWGLIAGNSFDHFIFQPNTTFSFWNTPGNWKDAATGNVATMTRADGYANAILEFQTRDGPTYIADNNMVRMTLQEFMLNQLRLTGNFTGATSRQALITDRALLLTKSLSGTGPQIRLDATSSGTAARFRFEIHNELQLLDDLEITGNGTQDFFIYGSLRDAYEPRNVTKTGTSRATLLGHNTFRGALSIVGGEVNLSGPQAAIDGASQISISSAGTLSMESGLIAVERIDRSAGGAFEFSGGELRVTEFVGSLTNQGGNFSPGASPAISTLSGDFAQPAGSLTIELAGTTAGTGFDQLNIGGTASLGGTLRVSLLDEFLPAVGSSFEFLHAGGGITGTFATTFLPVLPGRTMSVQYDANSVRLLVEASGTIFPGDYNFDGIVDASDYVVWRNTIGSSSNLAADGNLDGVVDQDDYTIWRGNFGNRAQATAQTAANGSALGVPEPSTVVLCLLALLPVIASLRRRAW